MPGRGPPGLQLRLGPAGSVPVSPRLTVATGQRLTPPGRCPTSAQLLGDTLSPDLARPVLVVDGAPVSLAGATFCLGHPIRRSAR